VVLAAAGTAFVLWHGREVVSCGSPTASVATDHPLPIGSRDVPTIGSIAVHTDPYEAGSPTRTHIEARAAHPDPITLTGFRCSDHAKLRFWFDSGFLPDPGVALGKQGTTTITIPRGPAGEIRHGYMLFTTTGDWLVVATTSHGLLGTLLVHVRAGGVTPP